MPRGRPARELAGSLFVCGEWEAGEAYAAQVPATPPSRSAINLAFTQEYGAWVRGRFDEAQAILDRIPSSYNPRTEASLELMHMQLDMARGTDSGAAVSAHGVDRPGEPARLRERDRPAGMGPRHLAHAPRRARSRRGRRDRVAHRDRVRPGAPSRSAALLTLGRLEEARGSSKARRTTFWGCEAGAIRATVETVLTRLEGDYAAAEQIGHDTLVAHHRGGFRLQLVHTLEALAGLAAAAGFLRRVRAPRGSGAGAARRDGLRAPLAVRGPTPATPTSPRPAPLSATTSSTPRSTTAARSTRTRRSRTRSGHAASASGRRQAGTASHQPR